MPLSPASRLADFGTGIGTAGAVLKVDNPNKRVGIGTAIPTATLGVAGIVSATAFYGDGSNLDGVASAGLGTALSEVEFDPLTVIYQTSDTLSVGATITVDPPNATTKVAYTQYADIKLEDDADLIVADGDDFIPDILGLSTEGFSFNNANGNGVFDAVYTDNIERADGRGAPNLPLGMTVSGVSTFTGAASFSGNVSVGGTLTYEDVTNVDSIGVVTARNGIKVTTGGIEVAGGGANVTGVVTATGGIDVTAGGVKVTAGGIDAVGIITASTGFNAASNLILNTGGSERLRIGSAGQLGIAGANYGTDGQVLTSKGNSAAVEWASPSSALTRIAGGTVSSSVSSIDMGTTLFSSNVYQFYTLRVWLQGAGSIKPTLQVYTGGAWQTGNDYKYQVYYSQGGGIWNGNQTITRTGIDIGSSNAFNRSRFDWTANFCNMNTTNYAKTINVEFDIYSDNLGIDHTIGRQSGGWDGSNAAITGMRINTWDSGANFTSGAWVIHGYN